MSCYRRPGEVWTIYELDPLMERIAKNPALFRSFSACAPSTPVILGDARLTLKDAARGIDLLVLDAFTSDSVPVHLLTREAFALYRSKLSAHGVVVFHISNRNLELAGVVAASAAANGMPVAVHRSRGAISAETTPPEVVVAAQSRRDLTALKLGAEWESVRTPPGFRTWTDDYSNILGVLLERLAGRN
ncbi:MAG: fused MFS/spermidine synthase [Rhizomicrobium sp.]